MVDPDRVHESEPRAKAVLATLPPGGDDGARRQLDDLHDGVIQTLFGVGLTLQAAAATAGQEALANRLEEAAGNLAKVVRELREYAAKPDVEGLDRFELEQVIRALARELAAGGGVRLRLRGDPGGALALGGGSYALVEMVAALLAVLARRRGAGQGTIRLRRGRRWARLQITIQGAGTRPAPGWSRHERLRLRAQAARLGCRLVFMKEAGPVARATVWVPLRSGE